MSEAATAESQTPSVPEIEIIQTFNAPREAVFAAWTEPTELIKWWGPKGMHVPECRLDLKEDGSWRTVMRSNEGNEHIVSGVYKEISPPHRLSFTWAWETDGERGHETLVTIDFVEEGTTTKMIFSQAFFAEVEQRNMHIVGWASSFGCLTEAISRGDIG